MRLLTLFLLLGLLACEAPSKVLYADARLSADIVNGTYSVANRNASGADGNAYRRIQTAVNAMSPGDVLYLRGGTFVEYNIDLSAKRGRPDAWLTMASYPGEWAVVDGRHPGPDADIFRSTGNAANAVSYWRFEYFEVTGAGPDTTGRTYNQIHMATGSGFFFWPGHNITFDHMVIRDNYGGGGNNGGAGIKFMNSSDSPHHITITHCHFRNNGWPGSANANLGNIIFFSDYQNDPARVDMEKCQSRNLIAYNLMEGSAFGFKNKNSQFLARDHLGQNMTYKAYGNRFHHNIVRGAHNAGFLILGDFSQVHHNVVENCPTGIIVGEPPSSADREPFHVAVYNNTIIAPQSAGITTYHGWESGSTSSYTGRPLHPYHYIWNNIIHKVQGRGEQNDLTLLFTYSQGQQIDMATVQVDHNYFHPRVLTDKVINLGYLTNDFTAAQFKAQGWAKTLYVNAERAADPLFKPNLPYRTRGEHVLEGSVTLARGGRGGNHPYLPGESIPSYIGATDPANDGWVQEVLDLADLPRRALDAKLRLKPKNLPGRDYRPLSR